ncbi:nucleotide pyrophosphohydrolase [Nocardiopsis dassonvillei]|uniref:nucleotide pyrophosphohydrolase n=1 Tax=Nocardiopsis dassonvillei TaxID=2014 RepID=UPI0033F974DA
MGISSLQTALADFATDRDWGQFHNPKNLVMALSGEVGELAAEFQWLTPEQASQVMEDTERAEAVRHELADVFSYLLRLADVLDVDLEEAVQDKIRLNEQRYPVAQAQGNALKYTAFHKQL